MAYKFRKMIPSAPLTSSGVIYVGQCFYFGFVCNVGGASGNIIFYDNASAASGASLEGTWALDNTKKMDGHEHANPIFCQNGLYLSTPGQGESVIAYYLPTGVVQDNY